MDSGGIEMSANRRALRAFTAVLLALLMIPAVMGSAVVPIEGHSPGDISGYENFLDSQSYVRVKTPDGHVVDSNGGVYDSVPDNSTITIHYAFSLKDSNGESGDDYEEYSYYAGDFFTVDLPEGLQYAASSGTELQDQESNATVGTLDVTSAGQATVTLKPFVEGQSGIHAEFDITAKITNKNADYTEPILITFDATTVTIHRKPPTPDIGITKAGSYDASENEITWTVTVTPPEGKSVGGVSVKDSFGPNQTYVPNSFTVRDSANPDPSAVADDDPELHFDDSGFTYEFPDPISTAQIITYRTQPESLKATGSSKFTNNAGVYVDGNFNKQAEAGVVTLNWISKSHTSVDPKAGTITWTVKAGLKKTGTVQDNTLKNAVIKDSLPAGLELDTKSVKWTAPNTERPVTVTEDTSDSPAEGKFHYDTATRMLTYNAGDLTGQGILTYTARVLNHDEQLNTNGSVSFGENRAWLTWDQASDIDSAPSDSDTAGFGANGLIDKWSSPANGMSGNPPEYNDDLPGSDIIQWTIVVDRNYVPIDAASVTDTFGPGQTYVENSLKVDGNFPEADKLTMNSSGFTYDFGEIDEQHTITYQTKIHKFYLYANGTVGFQNTATLKNNTTVAGTVRPTQNYSSEVLNKAVAVGYDYSTQEVQWKITVDRNNMDLENVTVVDDIPEGMTYVPGSVKYIEGSTEVEPPAGSVEIGSTADGARQTVTLRLGDLDEQRVLTLKTRLSDELIQNWTGGPKTFENLAEMTSGSYLGTIQAKASTSALSFPIVSKTTGYDSGSSSDYIDWTVDINASQFDLGAGRVLTDALTPARQQNGPALSAGCLELDADSVVIRPATVDKDGKVTADASKPPLVKGKDYTVAVQTSDGGETTTTFRFADTFEVKSAYVLSYSTNIIDPNVGSVGNQITLSGKNNIGSGSGATAHDIDIGGHGGAGQAGIVVEKVDEDGKPLPSPATFRLRNLTQEKSNQGELAAQQTDGNGTAEFTGLMYHKYFVREISAPEGYLLSTDPLQRQQTVQLSSSNQYPKITFKDKQALGKVWLKKVFTDGNRPDGGRFLLSGTRYDGKHFEEDAGVSDGMVEFEDVPIGRYTITEDTPPEGYLKWSPNDADAKGIRFYAKVQYKNNGADQTGVETVYSTNQTDWSSDLLTMTDAPAKADFAFTKVDKNGSALPGAVFILKDAQGKIAAAASPSGEDGRVIFLQIPAGTYTVEETAAPKGYEKAQPFEVVVAENEEGTGMTVSGNPGTVTDLFSNHGGGGGDNGGGGGTPSGSSSGAPTASSAVSSAVSSDAETPGNSSSLSQAPGGGTGETSPSGPAALYIKKADPDGKALSGAEFTLFNASGKALQKKVTGASGVIVFQDLSAGSYIVKETKAPANYELYGGALDVTLSAGQNSGYTLRDSPKGNEAGVIGWTSDDSLPKTGELPMVPFVALGGLLLIGVGLFLRRRTKSFSVSQPWNKKNL